MRPSLMTGVSLLVLQTLSPALPASADTLLVANKSDDTVDLIDLSSHRSVVTLETGHAPHEIAVSPDGAFAVVTNYGDRDAPGSSLTVIEVESAVIRGEIDLGSHTRPHGVAFVDHRRVVVTTEGSGHLVVIDLDEGEIRTAIATGQDVSHMVVPTLDGKLAFVANIGSGSVTVIDLVDGKKLKDISTGEGAEGITATPDGKEIWVTNRGADTLSVIDPHTLTVLETIPCPGFPIRVAITPDGSRALVSAARSGEVVVFDTRQRLELTRTQLDLGNAPDASRRLFGDRFGESPVPVGLVIDPSGDQAWVAATQADAVVVIGPRDLVVRDLLRAGHEPDGMAFTPVQAKPSPRQAN